jgi:hypothetical protein
MNNSEKARIYEECIRDSDKLQRENSNLKSQYAGNIPPHVQAQIDMNDKLIAKIVARLENLFD